MRKFRVEKKLIKSIKSKSEIVDIRKDEEKLIVLDKIVKAYHEDEADKILSYKRYKTLEWEHIKHIKMVDLFLS